MDIQEAFLRLTDDEKRVLWQVCKTNRTYLQISQQVSGMLSEDWVQAQISGVYRKLEWETAGVHWHTLRNRLKREVCPHLPANLDDFLAPSGNATDPGEQPPAGIGGKGPGEMPPPPRPSPPAQPPARNDRRWLIFGSLAVIAGCLILLRTIFNRPPPAATPTAPAAASFAPPEQPTLAPTAVTVPTNSSQSLPAAPTNTLLPLPTAIPLPEVLDEGKFWPIKGDATIELDSQFAIANASNCHYPPPGFMMHFVIKSNSPFLLRFDPQAFSARDDLGNSYKLYGVGRILCDNVGPQSYQVNGSDYLWIAFTGQIPLNAQYLLITADSLSGVKLVFKKLL